MLMKTIDGNRIHLGIAEKLYTCVVGISMFFSAFVVALAVQWKLALITMSIVPGMVLSCGACIGAIVPIETELVSSACICASPCLKYILLGTTLLTGRDDSPGCSGLGQNHSCLRRPG
jgi:hypothetical protein